MNKMSFVSSTPKGHDAPAPARGCGEESGNDFTFQYQEFGKDSRPVYYSHFSKDGEKDNHSQTCASADERNVSPIHGGNSDGNGKDRECVAAAFSDGY